MSYSALVKTGGLRHSAISCPLREDCVSGDKRRLISTLYAFGGRIFEASYGPLMHHLDLPRVEEYKILHEEAIGREANIGRVLVAYHDIKCSCSGSDSIVNVAFYKCSVNDRHLQCSECVDKIGTDCEMRKLTKLGAQIGPMGWVHLP